MPDDDFMTEGEIAFRAAINVLWDSVESGRMPSGLPFAPDAADVHAPAAERLQVLLRRARQEPKP